MDGACARDIECYKDQGDEEDPAKQTEKQLPAREAETKNVESDVFQGEGGGHLWRCCSAGIWGGDWPLGRRNRKAWLPEPPSQGVLL